MTKGKATALLLLKDVPNLGRTGDLVTSVKPGFRRNYLLPQGFAEVATKRALRKQAALQEMRQKQAISDTKESNEIAARMKEITLAAVVKVDHEGHMYGSVSSQDIIAMLKEQGGIDIERRCVRLAHPIKQLGIHTVEFVLKEGIKAQVVLKITPEGGESVLPPQE